MAELENAAGSGDVSEELFNGVLNSGKEIIGERCAAAPPGLPGPAVFPGLFTLELARAFVAKKRAQASRP